MGSIRSGGLSLAVALMVTSFTGSAMGNGPIDGVVPVDCAGPAPAAVPGTPDWDARDVGNMYCAEQRHGDQAMHPAPLLAAPGAQPSNDGYREPSRHNGVRFRYQALVAGGLDVEVYRPCAASTCPNLPAGLRTFEGPYPVVVSLHGGLSRKELHWWSSQPLAEAGYMVVAFDSSGTSPTTANTDAILDWLFTPGNPIASEADLTRVGIAGHSAGGVVSSALGQQDERIKAVVSWDRAQSGQMPAGLVIRNPALFLFADYNCQAVPVCQPARYATAPNPDGPGNKGEDFLRVSAAGVDSMQIALRAALHLDFVPSELSGNRYVESVTMYYTTAWFDRYLKGLDDPVIASDAFARLTATAFNGSADVHNISQGLYDPVKAATAVDPYAGNVPYTIAGMSVSDRLSFYFRSKCFLTIPGSTNRATSVDMRTDGCSTG